MQKGDRYKMNDRLVTITCIRPDGWVITAEEGLVHSSELTGPALFILEDRPVFAGDRLWNRRRNCWCTILRMDNDTCWHQNDADPKGRERFAIEIRMVYSWRERA